MHCQWEWRLVCDLVRRTIWQRLSNFTMHMQCSNFVSRSLTSKLLAQEYLYEEAHHSIAYNGKSSNQPKGPSLWDHLNNVVEYCVAIKNELLWQ